MTEEEKEQELLEDPIMQLIIAAAKEEEKKVKILNPIRYMDVLIAKDALDDLLLKSGETERAAIKIHHAFSSASVCAQVESLEIRDMGKFYMATGKASNIEFYPLTNGKVSIAFTFQNVLIPLE